jgi:hypothetical protein
MLIFVFPMAAPILRGSITSSKPRSNGPVVYDTICTHVALTCWGACPTGWAYPSSVRKCFAGYKVTSPTSGSWRMRKSSATNNETVASLDRWLKKWLWHAETVVHSWWFKTSNISCVVILFSISHAFLLWQCEYQFQKLEFIGCLYICWLPKED